ncbi:MAG: TIGR03617 family F420-dependent LLM class oxidoreductase [Rhodoglobus sp.]
MSEAFGRPLKDAAASAESTGYDGFFVPELSHDPFIAAAAVADATERVQVGTQIAVAFARSPMTVAHSAHDVQTLSSGRFVLGLGTQVSAHITRRFSMPWSEPARRMSEYLTALKTIWASWRTGERLNFQGDFYTHTLTSPRFIPPVTRFADPAVWLAAVGPRMAQVAGAHADGIVLHGFVTRRYAQQVIAPAFHRGLEESGRDVGDFAVSVPVIAISGSTTEQIEASRTAARSLVAFYGSTPAYREVLAIDGWGDVADELHRLSLQSHKDRWLQMGELITEDILSAFAVEAAPEDLPARAAARFAGIATRISLPRPTGVTEDDWRSVLTNNKDVK